MQKRFDYGTNLLENAGLAENNPNLDKLTLWWKRLSKSGIDNKIKEFQWRVTHNTELNRVNFFHLNNFAKITKLNFLIEALGSSPSGKWEES